MSSDWAQKKERGSANAIRVGFVLLNFFGHRIGILAGMVPALYFFLTGKESRRASRDYLRRLGLVAPETKLTGSLRQAFKHHIAFTSNVIDRMWFWQGKISQYEFHKHGSEHLLARQGKGALLIGAHIGSFDAMRAFSSEKGVPINVIMYKSHARQINQLFENLDEENKIRVFEMEPGDMATAFELKERVAQGEFVALLADRLPPHGRPRYLNIPFLGQEAAFPQNPWILASLLGCPVLTTICVRDGFRKYQIYVEPIADKIILPRKQRTEAIRDYMSRYVGVLEKMCRLHPYQWFNFYDYWAAAESPETQD